MILGSFIAGGRMNARLEFCRKSAFITFTHHSFLEERNLITVRPINGFPINFIRLCVLGNICSYTHYIYSLLDKMGTGFITFDVSRTHIYTKRPTFSDLSGFYPHFIRFGSRI